MYIWSKRMQFKTKYLIITPTIYIPYILTWQCYYSYPLNIGIIHVGHALTFTGSRGSCWNTRPPGRVFKHLPRDSENDHYSCILADSNLKSHRKSQKNIKIIVFRSLDLFDEMASAAKSNVKVIISANNVDVNKSIEKILIPGRNVSPRNVMQTNLGLS